MSERELKIHAFLYFPMQDSEGETDALERALTLLEQAGIEANVFKYKAQEKEN